MTPTRFFACTTAILASPGLLAHPGHSLSEESWGHWLTSPDHLLVLGLLGIAFVVLARLIAEPRLRKAARFAGAAMIVAALAIWGFAA
ncbi:MAG TPA: hypothetical protein VEH27_06185 [Methylomirabilota bacterium]|nr:hypothetical protein [Methylomirabilota bacterium]